MRLHNVLIRLLGDTISRWMDTAQLGVCRFADTSPSYSCRPILLPTNNPVFTRHPVRVGRTIRPPCTGASRSLESSDGAEAASSGLALLRTGCRSLVQSVNP